ncbi:MAG: CdaR family protein, partial [Hungatella sp.]
MKERLINNLGLKILAIFLAFFVWLIVVNVSNPVVTRTQEVPVEMIGQEILAKSNLTYEVLGKNSVTVSYEVRTRDAYRVGAGDFYVYADLAELYDVTGSIPLKVDIANQEVKSMIEGTPTAKPGVIRVKTEKVQKKRFDLQVRTNGTPEEGYALGTISLVPDYVYVTGAVSVIGQINSVGVEINNLEGINSELVGTASPVYYDANGNTLDLAKDTKLNISEITYQIPILKVKNLNLSFQVAGTVAEGYRFIGAESDIESISVQGMKSVLAPLTALTIADEQLNLNGAMQDVVVKVDLNKYLPENVTVAGDTATVATVTLKVEQLETRSFLIKAEDITLTGTSQGHRYEFDTEKVEVKIQGLREDLDSLKTEDLKPTIDVSNMQEGIYQGILTM